MSGNVTSSPGSCSNQGRTSSDGQEARPGPAARPGRRARTGSRCPAGGPGLAPSRGSRAAGRGPGVVAGRGRAGGSRRGPGGAGWAGTGGRAGAGTGGGGRGRRGRPAGRRARASRCPPGTAGVTGACGGSAAPGGPGTAGSADRTPTTTGRRARRARRPERVRSGGRSPHGSRSLMAPPASDVRLYCGPPRMLPGGSRRRSASMASNRPRRGRGPWSRSRNRPTRHRRHRDVGVAVRPICRATDQSVKMLSNQRRGTGWSRPSAGPGRPRRGARPERQEALAGSVRLVHACLMAAAPDGVARRAGSTQEPTSGFDVGTVRRAASSRPPLGPSRQRGRQCCWPGQ